LAQTTIHTRSRHLNTTRARYVLFTVLFTQTDYSLITGPCSLARSMLTTSLHAQGASCAQHLPCISTQARHAPWAQGTRPLTCTRLSHAKHDLAQCSSATRQTYAPTVYCGHWASSHPHLCPLATRQTHTGPAMWPIPASRPTLVELRKSTTTRQTTRHRNHKTQRLQNSKAAKHKYMQDIMCTKTQLRDTRACGSCGASYAPGACASPLTRKNSISIKY
jgi:hypothetical protein